MTAVSRWVPYSARNLFAAIAAVAVVCTATFVAWRILGRPATGIDDADIFLVYARNFVHGHGMVYNVGGEHVEGFSSFLFFWVCCLAYVCSSNPTTVLFVFGLLFTILTTFCALCLVAKMAERLALPGSVYFLFSAAYLAWIGFNPLYFAWNVISLMDTSLYSLILTASFAFLASVLLDAQASTRKDSLSIAILIALTVLVRPEGLLWAPLIFIAFAWLALNLTPIRKQALQRLILPLASLIVTTAALISFRLAYFGYPLPNTYYAKVTSSLVKSLADGRRYFYDFKDLYGLFIFVPICFTVLWLAYALSARKNSSTRLKFSILTTVFGIVALILPVMEGGEHFTSCRMYQGVFPLLFFSLVTPVLLLCRPSNLRAQFTYVTVLALLIGLTSTCSWRSFAANNVLGQQAKNSRMALVFAIHLTDVERENGILLHGLLSQELPTTGVAAAGGFAYGYQGTVYDLLGLNDVRMAHADKIKEGPKDHQSFNKGVFYQISPDIVVPWTFSGSISPSILALNASYSDPNQWENTIFKNIFNDDRFRSTYTAAVVSNQEVPGIQCYGFFNNQYLRRLQASKAIHVKLLPR